jgi:hypothetical protein
VCGSEDPKVVVWYVNMIKEQWMQLTSWQKGEQPDKDEGGEPSDDDDLFGDAGGYDDPENFGFGHSTNKCNPHHPLTCQPEARTSMGEQIRDNAVRKKITSTLLNCPKDPLNKDAHKVADHMLGSMND